MDNPSSTGSATGIQLQNLQPVQPKLSSSGHAAPLTPRPDYYSKFNPEFTAKFENLDEDGVYAKCEAALLDRSTKNFIVDFGGEPKVEHGGAWCALDLDSSKPETSDSLKNLLRQGRPRELRTRWINIFAPHTQKELVQTIAAHYGFTLRHTSVLTAPPAEHTRAPTHQKSVLSVRDRIFRRHPSDTPDIEDGSRVDSYANLEAIANAAAPLPVSQGSKRGGHMEIVSNVWHWHAVEWGGRFMCIGFNSLHQVPKKQPSTDDKDENGNEINQWREEGDGQAAMDKGENYPDGKRQWLWLVLCDDGTVLSLHEAPGRDVGDQELAIIRRNLVTVFRSLSRSSTAMEKVANSVQMGGMDELPFRRNSAEGGGSENVESGPSLLFYYLFDDWYSSLELVVGRGYPYSNRMRDLRREMQNNPELSQISRLHRLARQLATLKRMYETKKIIIDNVLYRQENSHKKNIPQSVAPTTPLTGLGPQSPVAPMGDPDVLGVPLNPLAIAKFERLRDRIKLYALGEINDCLQEKSELVDMTFNLIALRESESVERLTRVAILLTKFAFVFVPLTLITGYFSMQLKDVQGVYTQRDFWGTGGVFVFITILVLYTIGKTTDTMESAGMWKGFKAVWLGCFGKKTAQKARRSRTQQW
ncbi:hypothetical protein L873DRAFT_1809392 [Choiromyces venosus 120613-1]|uniref:Cora-domain-containing protein n=1 Tax=Choiromyces venosus 120613-1 TaxID=1336337 RepID=A0A3N4JV87_9PEZI|nr:hypothetical protein L873DRAFT_1809392 [Choiromyces venosus 120613-1]